MIRTQKQALKEAVRRWGKGGAVKDRGRSYPQRVPITRRGQPTGREREIPRFAVGRVELGMFFGIRGEGNTWEEAFEKVRR